MKVCKFGGSSVATAQMIEKVAQIIKNDQSRKFIVVSAPGKRNDKDIKVTDLFIRLGEQYISGQSYEETLSLIKNRFLSITDGLNLSGSIVKRIQNETRSIIEDIHNNWHMMDALKAMGEDSLARILSAYLNKIGVHATYINPKDAGVIVSDEPGSAQILEKSYEEIYKLRNREGVLVIPGFYGYTEQGVLMTFPRGGSDITGSIIASGVEADLYENFTDVSSVYCVNPNIVDNPKEIPVLTYKEMRELSYAGFSVFHDEALIPAFKKNIPVCIKNTNDPDKQGTMIVANKEYQNGPVVGIASDKGFSTIFVSKYLMNRELGFGKNLLHILVEEDISFEHAPSGIDDMSVIVRTHQLTEEKEKKLLARINHELHADTASITHGLAIIMLVGEGMGRKVNVASKATRAFGDAGVNIEMINQGSSEVSMMFGIREKDLEKAVRSLYQQFFT
ncbi:aspartate kinase [Bacillaceae bacterium W0354]